MKNIETSAISDAFRYTHERTSLPNQQPAPHHRTTDALALLRCVSWFGARRRSSRGPPHAPRPLRRPPRRARCTSPRSRLRLVSTPSTSRRLPRGSCTSRSRWASLARSRSSRSPRRSRPRSGGTSPRACSPSSGARRRRPSTAPRSSPSWEACTGGSPAPASPGRRGGGRGASAAAKEALLLAGPARFAWSVVPSLLAWPALMCATPYALVAVAASLAATLAADAGFAAKKLMPRWLMPMRFGLTGVAVLGLLASVPAALEAHDNEREREAHAARLRADAPATRQALRARATARSPTCKSRRRVGRVARARGEARGARSRVREKGG